MYCTNCGQKLPENATVCANCGQRVQRPAPPPSIPNYLVQSIIVTLCCCVPFGIVAIVYSAQVNTKVAAGDIAGALESSRKAKMWGWIAFGAGALIGILYAIIGILGGLSES